MRVLVLISLLLLSASCGPARSTLLINDAKAALEGARVADAAKYAPYEFTASESYLEKAREEQGYADFEPAIVYAEKAKEYAEKAVKRAQQERRTSQEDSTTTTIVIEKEPNSKKQNPKKIDVIIDDNKNTDDAEKVAPFDD